MFAVRLGARRGRSWSLAVCLVFGALGWVTVAPEPAAGVPPEFSDEFVANVSQPMGIAWTPDGRALVPTKTGQVRIIQNGTLLATPALDLSGIVCTDVEWGLGGLAVHPQFAANRYIYLYYTFRKFGACGEVEPVNRLSRFELLPSNVIDPTSELVLLDTPPLALSAHHNGGDIEFGADGYLYVTIGDGHQAPLARDLGRLLGKVVRVTDDGDVPATNPYTGPDTARCNIDGVPPAGSPPGTKCQEVYASGLRNPFRMARDPNAPGTRIFVNDVGQDFWEEIDELAAGKDYGWPSREGPCARNSETNCTPPSGPADPLHWYGHQGIGGSITGGAFVPNGVWPSEYDGKYLFADYVFEQIYRLDAGGPNCRLCIPPTSNFTQTVFTDAPAVVDIAFGPHAGTQALYYVTRQSNAVRRIVHTGSANRSPTAVATATPPFGALPLTVDFDSSGSSDPDDNTLTYTWDFKDGSPIVTSADPVHTFTTAGTYQVELTVDDGNGGTNTTTVRVDAGNLPPEPVITTPTSTQEFSVGEVLTLAGSASDPEDGALGDTELTWEVRQHHHTHFHPHLDPTPGNNLTVTAPEPEDFNSTEDSYLEVLLTATDSNGLSRTVSRAVQPRRVDLTFESVPSGFDLVVEGQQITAPTTLVGWKDWKIEVEAPDQLDDSGVPYQWTSWSDDGSQTHEVTVPGSPTTYTANFVTGTSAVVVTPGVAAVTEVDAGSVLVNVPVRLNRASPTPVTIDWATEDTGEPGVATAGVDYVARSGTVTFAPGQTSQTVTITVLGDRLDELPLLFGEWGLVSFSNPSANATLDTSFFGRGIFVIVDNDPPMIRPGDASALEGDNGSVLIDVPVTLSSPSATPVTVDWATLDNGRPGIATAGADYVAGSGTVTFAPGQTSQTVPITVFGDTVDEPPLIDGEWGLVLFSNPSTNATLDTSFYGAGVFVIIDDD